MIIRLLMGISDILYQTPEISKPPMVYNYGNIAAKSNAMPMPCLCDIEEEYAALANSSRPSRTTEVQDLD
jgi:hypothetical protein